MESAIVEIHMKVLVAWNLIVNGTLGPGGPHAPKIVVPEWKHEHDLKVKKNHTVEYV